MREVEVKVVLMAPGALRERLRRLGAVPASTLGQVDHYLLHPCRDVAAQDEAVRVREERDETSGAARWRVAHKGARAPDGRTREEHEVETVDDPRPLLAALGFRPAATVRKRREPWRLGSLWVVLDDVEGLGRFAEVEALVDDGGDAATAGARVEAALRDLGLAGAERVTSSYLELLTS